MNGGRVTLVNVCPCLNGSLANVERLKLKMLSENAGAMLVELSGLGAMRQVLAS
jgi:hypothetical protein